MRTKKIRIRIPQLFSSLFLLFAFMLIQMKSHASASKIADAKACINKSLITKTLSHLTLHRWTESAQSWEKIKPTTLCDDNSIEYKTVKALIYLKKIEDQSKNNGNSFHSLVFKEGPLSFFKSRVKNIYFEPKEQNFCRELTLAYVLTKEKNAIHICTGSPISNESVVSISSVLIHEAHHNRGFLHVKCTHGIYFELEKLKNRTNSLSCDNDYESQGSYGLNVSYLLDILKITKNPIHQQISRQTAIAHLLTNFNKLPMGIQRGNAVASLEKKAVYFYPYASSLPHDNKKKTGTHYIPQKKPTPSSATKTILDANTPYFSQNDPKVITVNKNKLYFYSDSEEVLVYNHNTNLFIATDPFSRMYKSMFDENTRKTLIDVFYPNLDINYGCFLFQKSLFCKQEDSSNTHQIQLTHLEPHGFYIYKNATTRRDFYLLLDKSGRSYQLPNDFSTLSKMNENDINNDPYFSSKQKNSSLELLSLWAVSPLSSSSFLREVFTLPSQNILMKINSESTWILGLFYWSAQIEAL